MSADPTQLEKALALHQNGQLAHAKSICEDILSTNPNDADALHLLGVMAYQSNNLQRAIELFNKAIDINSLNPLFYSNRGKVLQDAKQLLAAIENYDQAIRIKPDFAAAYFNRGCAQQALMEFPAAIKSYDAAIALKSDFVDAYFNRGNALLELKQAQDAIDSYQLALNLNPEYANIYVNLGLALQWLRQFEAAVESYDHAIKINPAFAEAYFNRGNALQDLRQFEAAVASYQKALALKPSIPYLLGTYVHTKMKLCDWIDFERDVSSLIEKINRNEKASPGYPLLALTNSLAIQRKVTEIYAQDKRPLNSSLGAISTYPPANKIRIGYFSADFRVHPILFLLSELFERHDKNRFELIAFSFGPNTQDALRLRAQNAFDQFIDVRHHSDKEVALLARQLNIDIAIDLGGDTTHSRSGIFAYRAAPIQAGYLGWPGTMGADYFDYVIADHLLIPQTSQRYYSEKIVYLPNSYQANDTTRKISNRLFSRAELGLPETGFIFCCFNNNHKITPHIFDSWMRILTAVKDSVLFLYADNKIAEHNLRKEAQSRGVDAHRLVFAQGIEVSDYLARYKVADLFLNTFPYDAGTTASDALWVGVPILTRTGETFVSRVAASLLQAIGLPELITHSQEAYEALAIELATHPDKLHAIKMKLAANKLTMPLFNTPLFTQHLENAYTQMVARYRAGLPPDHIYVDHSA